MYVSGSRLRCRLQDPPIFNVHVHNDVRTRWTPPDCIRSRPIVSSYAIGNFRRGTLKFYPLEKRCPVGNQNKLWPFCFSPFCGKTFVPKIGFPDNNIVIVLASALCGYRFSWRFSNILSEGGRRFQFSCLAWKC